MTKNGIFDPDSDPRATKSTNICISLRRRDRHVPVCCEQDMYRGGDEKRFVDSLQWSEELKATRRIDCEMT